MDFCLSLKILLKVYGKTASNWAIQKKAETTSNFIGNKFADKITRTKLQIADTALQTDIKSIK